VLLGVRGGPVGGYAKIILVMAENTQKMGLKLKHKNKVMKFWFTKKDLRESSH
jgi:hypothetical protein